MAAITSRSQVIEVEPQVRPHFDWDLVIGVQVPLPSSKASAQLGEHFRGGRRLEPSLAAIPNNVRLPIAIHTPPAVSLETQNPQPPVHRIVAALCAGAAAFIIFTLSCPTVPFAESTTSQFGTARSRARVQYPNGLRIVREITPHSVQNQRECSCRARLFSSSRYFQSSTENHSFAHVPSAAGLNSVRANTEADSQMNGPSLCRKHLVVSSIARQQRRVIYLPTMDTDTWDPEFCPMASVTPNLDSV